MIAINDHVFSIENDVVRRELRFCPMGGLYTSALIHKATGTNFAKEDPGHEFMVRVNDDMLYGYQKPAIHEVDGSMVEKYFEIEFVAAIQEVVGEKQTLRITLKTPRYGIKVVCCYQCLSDTGCLSKWIEISAAESVYLTQFNFEVINAYPGSIIDNEIYRDQRLAHHSQCFSVNGEHDRIAYFNLTLNESLVVASNVPGKLRRFLVYPNWTGTALMVGLNAEIGSGVHLEPNLPYVSHQAYIHPLVGSPNTTANANRWRDEVRQQLPEMPHQEGFMYCTWLPFMKNINEALLLELIDDAADLGMAYFVIDDGWFVSPNWTVDAEKFPHGLEPIMERIHERGLKAGLWFNVGNHYGDEGTHENTYRLDARGEKSPLGFSGNRYTRCMASRHRDRMADVLKDLATRYNIYYFKLDFSSISSPYGILPLGCHATDHAHHRHAGDSVAAQYRSMLDMRNQVKSDFPNLIIDFSFECFGSDEPSIAALQYSEMHHMSNLSTNNEKSVNPRLIRQALYHFCAQVPAERILGSLLCLQGTDVAVNVESVLTAIAGAPLVAGNLITMPEDVKDAIKKTISLINPVFEKGHLTQYEVLNRASTADPSQWDGFARYNKKGDGVICAFRNAWADATVTIRCSEWPRGRYTLARFGKSFQTLSHHELEKGFTLSWDNDTAVLLSVASVR